MNHLLLFITIVVLLFSFDYKLAAQCNHQDDYTALKSLYLATNGDRWLRDRSGWPAANEFNENPLIPDGTDMDNWSGIDCRDGRVVNVRIGRNNLIGSIPAEISLLENLEQLMLDENQLRGEIPAELGELTNLETLTLGGNDLEGSIPPELGNLIQLRFLYLGFNKLSGNIPPELSGLTKVNRLALNNNQLTGGIPPEFENNRHNTI